MRTEPSVFLTRWSFSALPRLTCDCSGAVWRRQELEQRMLKEKSDITTMKRRLPPGWVQKRAAGVGFRVLDTHQRKTGHPEIILVYAACEGMNAVTGFK